MTIEITPPDLDQSDPIVWLRFWRVVWLHSRTFAGNPVDAIEELLRIADEAKR